jgi:hypothetical protein
VAPILDQWASAMPSESNAAVERTGAQFAITTCDPGAAADVKIAGKPSEALALPATRLDIWGLALQNKVPAEQASCIAKSFIDQLPLDEATSQNPDKADIQKRLSAAKTACA